MNELIKRFLVAMLFCLTTTLVYSQVWTAQDSLHLKKMLGSDHELNLNQDVIKQIDLGGVSGIQRMSSDKSWMQPDVTLPRVLPKTKVILTLMPYTANTKFNWDPIYQKKIRINKDTWRGDPFYELRTQRSYSNWAHNPMEAGERNSIDAIRASGVTYHQLRERANGQYVNSVVMGNGIPLGKKGVTINGGTISGLDLMTVFTKDFWDKKGRGRRERTLEVLRTYGDSTTININVPIEQIAR